jgi:F0F1-type ATP synthase assembly protein I
VIPSLLLPSRSNPPDARDEKGGDARDWTIALREAAPLLSLGTTLAVTVAAMLGLGYWLDTRLGTRPWLLLAGGCLGVAVALYQFIRTVTRYSSSPKR